MVEAYSVGHRPVGPSQPFRAGDSPTPKGGKLSCVTGGGEGVAGPSSMLSTLCQIDVNTTCLSACTWTVSCATRIALHLPPVPARQILVLHRRQSASECRYSHNALFSLQETKSASNAEQPQAALVV